MTTRILHSLPAFSKSLKEIIGGFVIGVAVSVVLLQPLPFYVLSTLFVGTILLIIRSSR